MEVSRKTRREQLIERAIGVSTLAQITEVRRAIRGGLTAHPEDEAVKRLEEHLGQLGNALRQQTAEAVAYNTTLPTARPRQSLRWEHNAAVADTSRTPSRGGVEGKPGRRAVHSLLGGHTGRGATAGLTSPAEG